VSVEESRRQARRSDASCRSQLLQCVVTEPTSRRSTADRLSSPDKTPYSGLETHIQNSYANAHLQALYYLGPLRRIAKAHILDGAPGCSRENCLLCEAGFLFRMLETAKGANCQATNFLKALGTSERGECAEALQLESC
jgi:hypothetical protein